MGVVFKLRAINFGEKEEDSGAIVKENAILNANE